MKRSSNSIPELIHQLAQQQQTYIQAQLKPHQLTLPQARMLNYIHAHPQSIQKELAHYLGKPEATLTNMLKALEQRQLIIRTVPEHNPRQKQLSLTEAGQQLVQYIADAFQSLDMASQQPFSKNEQQQLSQWLIQLLAHLNQST